MLILLFVWISTKKLLVPAQKQSETPKDMSKQQLAHPRFTTKTLNFWSDPWDVGADDAAGAIPGFQNNQPTFGAWKYVRFGDGALYTTESLQTESNVMNKYSPMGILSCLYFLLGSRYPCRFMLTLCY
ncbi:uncharacterized protein LOC116805296 [Drosophila grimshawi]|uniref:uncharacterized protein LOC116805296 n=1 Tax=Drosophila grimshawi TaxID=7222 RepID=UPI0013EF32FD|nr:uncharacterized protein LOC116805296 [Drosophila grimshawi]